MKNKIIKFPDLKSEKKPSLKIHSINWPLPNFEVLFLGEFVHFKEESDKKATVLSFQKKLEEATIKDKERLPIKTCKEVKKTPLSFSKALYRRNLEKESQLIEKHLKKYE